jgi:hypothetical protein
MGPNQKPLPPEPPEDYCDPVLCRAFGVLKDADQEPFGALKKRTVLETYPKQTEPVRTPYER